MRRRGWLRSLRGRGQWLGALAVLWAAGACRTGSAGDGRLGLDAAVFPAAPAQNVAGSIAIEARYYLDHKRVFGVDLPREAGVVPLALKLGQVDGSQGQLRFDPREAAPRLYLTDGTVLALRAPESMNTKFKIVNDRAVTRALDARVLPPWSAASDAYLYFEWGPEAELFMRRGELLRRVGESSRTVGLAGAILGLEVEVDGQKRTVHVGLAVTNGAGGK